MLPAVPLRGVAAPLRKPTQGAEIDAALQAKVAAREITGVVATVTQLG
jgi:hypothetical protein